MTICKKTTILHITTAKMTLRSVHIFNWFMSKLVLVFEKHFMGENQILVIAEYFLLENVSGGELYFFFFNSLSGKHFREHSRYYIWNLFPADSNYQEQKNQERLNLH